MGKVSRHRSFVFYGRSGTGKTTLSASFPKPILLLDVNDKGTDSIADIEGIDVKDINSWEDFEDTYWWLKENPKAYKTVIIDTVSQLQQTAVEKVMIAAKKDLDKAGNWGSMTKGMWGDVAQMMKTRLVNFRDLPMEVVFIAQDRVFNGEEDQDDQVLAPEVGPRLSPSVASVLNAAVSVIGNTFIRQRTITKEVNKKKIEKKVIEYCLRLGANSLYVTKIRKPKSNKIPSSIVDPTYEAIIETITGE